MLKTIQWFGMEFSRSVSVTAQYVTKLFRCGYYITHSMDTKCSICILICIYCSRTCSTGLTSQPDSTITPQLSKTLFPKTLKSLSSSDAISEVSKTCLNRIVHASWTIELCAVKRLFLKFNRIAHHQLLTTNCSLCFLRIYAIQTFPDCPWYRKMIFSNYQMFLNNNYIKMYTLFSNSFYCTSSNWPALLMLSVQLLSNNYKL